ncbi:MAG: hypothetical protein KDA05_00835 [Phycisphaerales bacterium]|nr:hypothetical protein [Phycisphaerales bacterium]
MSLALLPPIGQRVASAQTLNLGTPERPDLGEDAADLALARQTRAEGEAIADDAPGREVRVALRRLAGALLETSARQDQRGAPRALLGRTLVRLAPAIDAACSVPATTGGLDEPQMVLIAADLDRLGANSGDDVEAIERALRVVLAPVMAMLDASADAKGATPPPVGGWITIGAPVDRGVYATAVSRLTTDGSPLSSVGVEALRRLDQTIQSVDAHRGFRRSGESLRLALVQAAPAADTLPRWLAPTAVTTLVPAFERALVNLADPARRAQGLEEMRRLGVLMGLVQRTDRLPDNQAGRRAREALSAYIAVPPSNRELEARVLSAYSRGLDLALAPPDLPDDRRLVRQIRPAWREFRDNARIACDRVAEVLPTLLNDSAAMTDPGVLALFNGAGTALGEARSMVDLSLLLAGVAEPAADQEPVAADANRDLAARVLSLAQAASRGGPEGVAAMRDLGTLGTDAAAWRVMPAEPGLRAAAARQNASWNRATDGRELDLLDLLDRTRAAYWANIAAQGTLVERAALRARLGMIADLLTTVREVAATLEMLGAPGGTQDPGAESASGGPAGGTLAAPSLRDWPGWELSSQSLELLTEGLDDACAETVSLALRGEDERARLRISAMRQDMAAALLPARLAVAYAAVAPRAAGVLDEIGTGAPDPALAWMPVERELLGEFCRAASELPGIRLRRDDAQDRQTRAYVQMLAEEALADLAVARQRPGAQ